MQEKEILINVIDPLEFFGSGNKKFKLVRKAFPKLKLVARGNAIKAFGEESELERFEKIINVLLDHLDRFQQLPESDILQYIENEYDDSPGKKANNDILVYGPGGNQVKARTANQRKLVKESEKNDMVFAVGPAGSGKTYTAVALAVRALKEKQVRRIILTRPAVEAGENLGFLPGDLKDKLDPYLQPLYDALQDMLPYEKLAGYLEKHVIEIAPLAFMRGRTLDHAYVILDEAQNATLPQMKMFLTRMGKHAKFIITGDMTQIDLPKHQKSGLSRSVSMVDGLEGVGIVRLTGKDIIRHKLVNAIIKKFENEEEL